MPAERISFISPSAMARACFCRIGSALRAVFNAITCSTPTTATLTMTMKMMSSIIVSPRWRASRICACALMDIPGGRLDPGRQHDAVAADLHGQGSEGGNERGLDIGKGKWGPGCIEIEGGVGRDGQAGRQALAGPAVV